MSNNSDPLFDRYAEMDFSDAKPVSEIPALAQLQAEHGGKSRITMRVDNDTLAIFKARAEMSGGNYQTLMNEALRQFAQGLTLADVVRETISEGIASGLNTESGRRLTRLNPIRGLFCRIENCNTFIFTNFYHPLIRGNQGYRLLIYCR